MAPAEDSENAETGSVAELPPGLDLLWGRRTPGRQGPKPGLSVEAIVEAAIRVADEEGLTAVSMARVAGELGVSTMALYRHVDSKDELLMLMWNASAAGLPPSIEGDGWRERLRSWAMQQWDRLASRTWVLEMPVISPPMGPSSLAWIEQALAALGQTGLNEAEKLGVVGMLTSYTFGEARMAYDARTAAGRWQVADYLAVVRIVADEETYPALHRAAWSQELRPAPGEDEDRREFIIGVERILDGIQALVDRRTAPPHTHTPPNPGPESQNRP